MVADLFPQHTTTMRVEGSHPLRRFSRSLAEMGLITGVLLRVFRSLVLSHTTTGFVFIGLLVIAAVFLVGMVTAHLANYPLHHWIWRAPAFVGFELLGEMVTSLLLVWLGREPYGTVRAHFDDWPGLMLRALWLRGLIILIWSAGLSVIVQIVRSRLVKEESDDPVVTE